MSTPTAGSAHADSVTTPPVLPTDESTARNSYVDLLRAVSIVAVVLGHWLATGVRREGGHVVGVDALSVIGWSGWVALLVQVVPVFFLVGGYANAVSWPRHDADGAGWASWVRVRVLRLLIPTGGYIAVVALVIVGGQLFGSNPRTLQQAAWALTLHLWFVAAYLVILFLTPALYAAHRRWGLLMPLSMGLLATIIDTGVVAASWHVVGWANYLLVWGTFHQLGFSWHDRSFTGRRQAVLAVGAVMLLVALLWRGPYPVSMVGVPGAHIENASPPSTALLAFGLAQAGLVMACEAAVNGWIAAHPTARLTISRLGSLTMPVYLWHMMPVVIVIEGGYLQWFGQPRVGSGRWWEQRPAWIVILGALLVLLLVVLAVVVGLFRRPAVNTTITSTPPKAGGVQAIARLSLSVMLATIGIGYLAIHGLARTGHLDPLPLGLLAVAMLLLIRRPTFHRNGF